jgi:hypothetical protein
VVTSAGETIKAALPGAGGANAYCASFKPGENNAETRCRSEPMSHSESSGRFIWAI